MSLRRPLISKPKRNPVPTNTVKQGHFDFGNPAFRAEAYVAGPQNERARAALDTWQSWPGGVFCLFGETGSGKSHLGTMWARSVKAPVIMGDLFDLKALEKLTQFGAAIAVIDQADLAEETALFALLTGLESRGGGVLFLSRDPPLIWPVTLPDLRSRLNAIACEQLYAPDTQLLSQLIIRQSAARGFRIDEAASTYLALRLPRTFEATREIVVAMQDVSSTTVKSPMALAQRALQAFYNQQKHDEDATDPNMQDLFSG
jgi:chromosomal replication initiation ATPase DnaA